MQRLRSLLFTPGDKPRMIEKALASEADAVIVDLEDAVAEDRKALARDHVRALAVTDGPAVYIRVNSPATDLLWDDLNAAVEGSPAGILVPKMESAEDVLRIDGAVTAAERRLGIEQGSIELLLLIESALGLLRAYDMARAAQRVASLVFASGEEGDLVADLGCEWSPEGTELLAARSQVIIAARAAGLDYPLDAVYMNIRDLDGLRREAEQARRIGYTGKACIHPAQVPVVNDVFTPSPEEVAAQRRIIEAFDEALAAGDGAVMLDGKMIDYANVKRARRILDLAGQAG
jgi:citrate lyase subunit beta / citryl-CoA lyase